MRIQFKTILGGLCLASLFCVRANDHLFAHDLPSDRHLPDTATIDCFAQNHAVPPISHDGCHAPRPVVANVNGAQSTPLAPINYSVHYRALVSACQQLWATQPAWLSLNNSNNDLSHWWNGVRQYLPDQQTASANQLIIAQPENGIAPSPRRRSTQSSLSQELAHLLKIIEDAQCASYSALHDLDAITASLAQTILPSSRALLHNFVTLALPHATQVEPLPLQVGPQFVIFGLNNQGHILLTVAQAQQWQFAVPQAQAAAANFASQAIAPLQQQLLTKASRQIEAAGNALLQLSQSLSQLSNANVAQRESHYLWK
jgi:hypothetical protein